MKLIIFVVDNFERASFFLRFTKALSECRVPVMCITGCYHAYIHLQTKGCIVHHIGKAISLNNEGEVDYVHTSMEVLSSDLTSHKAEKLACIYRANLAKLDLPIYAKVIIWNGHQLISLVCQDFFKANYDYEYKFIEISNLPKKLFVDGKGVNAASFLALSPQLLDEYPDVDEDVHANWLVEYKESKQSTIGQAKNIKSLPTDRIKFNFIGGLKGYKSSFDFSNIIRPSWLKVKLSRRLDLESVIENLGSKISDGYILFPMQVSSDTQLLINGAGYDNDKAIQYCIDRFSKSIDVVVKPHPAEKNLGYFLDLYQKYKHDVTFTLDDTNKLIEASSHIVTINSTVGLEAMIQLKDVTVLGEAIYKKFNRDRLLKYIHFFLIDGVDYFDSKEINIDKLVEIIGDFR